ncbi:3-hydroxyisobutyrate dehydrogenase [Lentzea sp. NBRC 105346]|uniref:NAD(P)-dependent oxidoreductase n=1 Tax=Lentzea sp. NBRC 105346 TaxID=3032205 RepID=UPI0024A09403|nr:NAD(P)-dependent oxidoreductase [Lentzea sp. NBRC 105346]GLZ36310.1 3-hydroxyisobutyrate dehydrogenase [Lentzea sp. NBRC 105346]
MDTKRLAFIGLGNMGNGMAQRLLDTGRSLTLYNRTAAKAASLVASGAQLAESAEEAARGADVVLLSLADEAAVEEVLFGRVLPVLVPGAYVVDTSTVSPRYAVEAAERLASAGVRRVEACVVGNPHQARSGELRVFTAGDSTDGVLDLLEALGSVTHLGPAGHAATLKLVFNLVLGAQVAALVEAVRYGEQAGLDRDLLLTSIAQSGFSSMVMKFRAELMKQRRYEPAHFRSKLMEKDLRLALDPNAGQFPVLHSVLDRFAAVVSAGDGDKDAAVVLEHA